MAIDESTGGDGIVTRKDVTKVEDLRGSMGRPSRGFPTS